MKSRSFVSFYSSYLYLSFRPILQRPAFATPVYTYTTRVGAFPSCKNSSHHTRRFARTLQSSAFSYTFGSVAVVFVGSSVIAYNFLYLSSLSRKSTAQDSSSFSTNPKTHMPAQTLPGRPENLTPEQEAKLREFWRVVLQIFGVATAEDSLEPPAHTDTLSPPSADPKQKKKRLGIFKRSKKDGGKDDDSSSTATADSHSDMHIDTTDDKYGQTKEFHQALASLTPSDLRAAFWSMVKHDHPDGLLLRFLRARKWDVEKALVMLVSTMHWRLQEMHVDDDVVWRGEGGALEDSKTGEKEVKKDGEGFIEQLRMGKSFLHGTDKEGRPICVVRARLHRAGEQSEASLERYTVALIETARLLLVPPIDTAVSQLDAEVSGQNLG